MDDRELDTRLTLIESEILETKTIVTKLLDLLTESEGTDETVISEKTMD